MSIGEGDKMKDGGNMKEGRNRKMNLHNKWLPPPVAELVSVERRRFSQIVQRVKEEWQPDDHLKRLDTVQWCSLINTSVPSLQPVLWWKVLVLMKAGNNLQKERHVVSQDNPSGVGGCDTTFDAFSLSSSSVISIAAVNSLNLKVNGFLRVECTFLLILSV